MRGLVDYQRNNGLKTREPHFARYEGNYNFTPDFYALATLAYERDVFSGFSRRFAESLGLGYKIVNTPGFLIAVEGGPALRQTRCVGGLDSNSFAARGELTANLAITDSLALSQNATICYGSLYSESHRGTVGAADVSNQQRKQPASGAGTC